MAFIAILFLIQLVHSFYIADEDCKPINKCPYSHQTQLKIFSKGLIKEDTSEPYVKTYLYCLNAYFECGYMLEEFKGQSDNQNGVYFGLGINLATLENDFYKKHIQTQGILDELTPFQNKNGASALEYLRNNPIVLTAEEIEEFNRGALVYRMNKLKDIFKLSEFVDVMSLSMPLLSLYLKNGNSYSTVSIFTGAREFEHVEYSIENLPGGDVFERKKQSMTIKSTLASCDGNHYINFLVDKSFNETYWDIIREIIQETSTSLPLNYFGITLYDKEATNELPFTADNDKIKTALATAKYQTVADTSLIPGLNLVEQNFNNIAKSEYEIEKILVIFIRSIQVDDKERLKQKMTELASSGVNVIFFGKKEGEVTRATLEFISQRKDNILLMNTFDGMLNNLRRGVKSLVASICLQHIELNLVETGKYISGNYKIASEKSLDYFHINCEPNKKYIIELWIKQEDYKGMNIFISRYDPYPDVNSHDMKHLGLRREKETPRMIISSDNLSELYLSVFSNALIYSLNITKDNDSKEVEGSNGNFLSFKLSNFGEIQSFFNCYSSKCSLKDIPLLKYYARGVHPKENIEPFSYQSDLFHCLIPVYTCGYYRTSHQVNDKDKKEGVLIGSDIALKQLTNVQLKTEYNLPRLLINKMHKFLSKYKNETEQSKIDLLEVENLNFTWNETELIYSKGISVQILALKKSFQIVQGSLQFDEVNENIRFLLLARKFLKRYSTSTDDIVAISSENYAGYLNNISKIQDEDFLPIKNFNYLLFQSAFYVGKEKTLIAFTIALSYLHSIDINDLVQLINDLCQNNKKLSLNVYDDKKDKLHRVFDFRNKSAEIKEKINAYLQKHPNNTSSQNSSCLNTEAISQAAINQFKSFDKGVKKVMIILAYENKGSINNAVTDSFNETLLENEGINTLLLTSLSQVSNTLERLKSIRKENIFHLFNITSESSRQLVSKAIRFLHIPLKTPYKIESDFFQKSPVFFELIRREDGEFKQVIRFNTDNLLVYTSTSFPYPSIYSYDKEFNGVKEIQINNTKTLFISIVSKDKDTLRVKMELYSCGDDSCSQIKQSSMMISFVALSGIALLGYTMFSFYFDLKKEKKKTNIFD